MEEWQEYLSEMVKEIGEKRKDEGEPELDEDSYNFLRKIANHNMSMNGELRGVQKW